MNEELKVGVIVVNSIGCGCDIFYQIVKKTPKTITIRELESKYINRNIKCQTCDIIPVKNKFANEKPIVLRIREDGSFGPVKRMIWWRVWEGKDLKQWSP